ncbi:MAG: carboxypeptidase regulatory-like domain-containing protein [Nakamurella sp.]
MSVLMSLLLVGSMMVSSPAGATAPESSAGASAPDDPGDAGKIDTDLTAGLAEKGGADFYIDFTEHADLSKAEPGLNWAEQGAAVVKALQTTADTSQAQVRRELDEAGVSYTSFWISNTILVRGGSQQVVNAMAARVQVEAIRTPRTYQIPEPMAGIDEQSVDAVEWGIDRIQADDVWSTFGVRGEGIVIGSIDTGVNFRHPALVGQYRGNSAGTFSHDYNWFDPSRVCAPIPTEPCDNNDHGTHTMGTMVGDDGGANQIGVAPRATWIAAKGCESGNCSDAALLASGQWMLAPTRLDGSGADPAKRPNIVNNSWGGTGGNSWYSDTIDAWRAAGIFPAFSNGNSGPSCGTAGSPGDDEQAFATASFGSNDAIANSSSRGAAGDRVKPNLAAPGVNVRSSVANGGYAAFSGSSMASPHTAGTVALMWSAAPTLVGDVPGTIALLNQTATDTADLTCGGTAANNNVWGEGKLDALAAVTQAPRAPVGTLTGVLTDAATEQPIAGVSVAISGPYERLTSTGPDGGYTVLLPAGDYLVTASAFGYRTASAQVTVTEGESVRGDLALAAAAAGRVAGTISGGGAPVANATVRIDGTPIPPVTTDADGRYFFDPVPFGTYRMTVTAGGCFTSSTTDLVVDGEETLDITLTQRSDGYGYTCSIGGAEYVEGDTPLDLVGDDRATAVDLPFPFFFYGTAYNRAFVSTNGHLNFLTASTAITNGSIPSSATPNAAVYPFWDDLNVLAGTGQMFTRTSGTAPNRSFLIEWRNVQFYNTAGLQIDVEAQLNEDGSVVTRYRNLGADPRERGNSATVGIENATGTVGLQYSKDTAALSDSQTIRIAPPQTGTVVGSVSDANDGAAIAGATVRALQGTAVVGTATAGADGTYSLRLTLGAYSIEAAKQNYAKVAADIAITDDGQTITNDFRLATAAAALTPESVSFLATGDQLRTTRLTLSNPSTSGVTLNYSLTDGQSWLWTVPASGAVPPGGTARLTVRADATGVAAGVQPGVVAVKTDAGRRPSIEIPVTLVVPAYRQGINAGGGSYVDAAGDSWSDDRAWTPGGYGYLGAGWTGTSRQPIANTDDDSLHQTQRESTSGYRFDNLPGGTYLVELDFTELRRTLAPGRRVFDVAINGQIVLSAYDPVAAVGTLALDHREFPVTVPANGAIAIDFGALRGKLPPTVTAVRVTHRPDR